MANYYPGNQSSTKGGQPIQSIVDIKCSNENIYVFPGSLSQNDIVIKYKTNNCRIRTPKHIHFAVDLLIKKEHDTNLVNSLIDIFIQRWSTIEPLTQRNYNSIINNIIISKNTATINNFNILNNYGTYSIEFLFNFAELLMLQEKTNYPNAYMFKKVLTSIRNNTDIYSIISTATHNGR